MLAGFRSYPSWIVLQVEAAEVGRDLVLLHGLSFTLPDGLFTALKGKKTHLNICFKVLNILS